MRSQGVPSIRGLLAVLVLAPLLPTLLALAALLSITYHQAREQVVQRTAAATRDIGFPVLERLHAVKERMELLASRVPPEGRPLDDFYRDAIAARDELRIAAIVLVDRSGATLMNTRLPPGARPVTTAPAAVMAVFQTGRANVSTLFIGPTSQVPQVTVTVPVLVAGNLRFSINAVLEAESFQAFLRNAALPPGWIATLADREGTVITRSTDHARYVGTRVPGLVLARADARNPGPMTDVPIDGRPAYTSVRRGVDYSWIIMAQAPQDTLAVPVRDGLAIAAAAVALAVAGSLALVLRLARQVTGSVDAVARSGRADAKGEAVLHFREAGEIAARLRQVVAREAASAQLLRERESQLQGILDSAWDAVVALDDGQRIVIYNRAAAAMFGWPAAEVLGERVEMLMPRGYRAAHEEHVRRFTQRADAARARRLPRTVWGLRRNGESFPMDAAISAFTTDSGRSVYTAILRDLTEPLRSRRQLEAAHAQLREMSLQFEARLLAEVELRQAAVANELHDSIGSALAGVSMLLASADAAAARGAAASDWLQRALVEVQKTAELTRRLARGILPVGSEAGALVQALEQFASDVSALGSVECRLVVDPGFGEVSAEVGNHVYRIVQEGVTNAYRHGGARHVQVKLAAEGAWRLAIVSDDGAGLRATLQAEGGQPAGVGMRSMRVRAQLIGGEVGWRTAAEGGCRVEVRWPVQDGGADPGPRPRQSVA